MDESILDTMSYHIPPLPGQGVTSILYSRAANLTIPRALQPGASPLRPFDDEDVGNYGIFFSAHHPLLAEGTMCFVKALSFVSGTPQRIVVHVFGHNDVDLEVRKMDRWIIFRRKTRWDVRCGQIFFFGSEISRSIYYQETKSARLVMAKILYINDIHAICEAQVGDQRMVVSMITGKQDYVVPDVLYPKASSIRSLYQDHCRRLCSVLSGDDVVVPKESVLMTTINGSMNDDVFTVRKVLFQRAGCPYDIHLLLASPDGEDFVRPLHDVVVPAGREEREPYLTEKSIRAMISVYEEPSQGVICSYETILGTNKGIVVKELEDSYIVMGLSSLYYAYGPRTCYSLEKVSKRNVVLGGES